LRNYWKCLHSAIISSHNANNSFRVLQALSTLNTCRQVCVSATEMPRWCRRSALTYHSGCKYRSKWEKPFIWVRKAAPMDYYANCGTIVPEVCNLTNHEKSEKHL